MRIEEQIHVCVCTGVSSKCGFRGGGVDYSSYLSAERERGVPCMKEMPAFDLNRIHTQTRTQMHTWDLLKTHVARAAALKVRNNQAGHQHLSVKKRRKKRKKATWDFKQGKASEDHDSEVSDICTALGTCWAKCTTWTGFAENTHFFGLLLNQNQLINTSL